MASKTELMAAGLPRQLAMMCGQNALHTVIAAGVDQSTATPLIYDFALLTAPGANQGVRLGYATGSALTALLNIGTTAIWIYPAEDDSLNGTAPDLPISLVGGGLFLGIPSGENWLAALADAGTSGVGEYLSTVNTTAVTLPNQAWTQVATLALTPGDWDVWGQVNFAGSGSAVQYAAIVTPVAPPTGSLGDNISEGNLLLPSATASGSMLSLAPARFDVTIPTTIYLEAYVGILTGTVTATGKIAARLIAGPGASSAGPPIVPISGSGTISQPGTVSLVNNTSGAPITLTLAPGLGEITIKDVAYNANLYPITVQFSGGIDGQPSFTLAVAGQWVTLLWTGTGYAMVG